MKELCTRETIGPDHIDDPLHVEAIKGPLTRNFGAKYNDIHDEIGAAFSDYILPKDGVFCVRLVPSVVSWLMTRLVYRMDEGHCIHDLTGHSMQGKQQDARWFAPL